MSPREFTAPRPRPPATTPLRAGEGSWDQLHVCEKDRTKSLLHEAFHASPGKGELSVNLHHPSALRGIASLQKLQFIRINSSAMKVFLTEQFF